MSSDYWTESFDADSVRQQEAANAEWNEWAADLERDRQILLEWPPHPMDKMASNEERRKQLEPRYAAAVAKFYGKDKP